MLTAVLVCTIVMFLSITAVALSDHSLGSQRVDRKRVTTVHSAESGLDKGLQALQTSDLAALPCASPLAGSLGSGPGAADFSVTFQYFDSSNAAMPCPLASPPASVLLTSVGDSSDPVGRPRKFQLMARLGEPVNTTDLDKVIFSDGSIAFGNNVSIDGYTGSDAVVYTNGDYLCRNSYLLVGIVYAQGTATLEGSCGVRGDVWANGAVSITGSGVIVGRDATSSTSSVTISSSGGLVRRNVRAGTSITTNNAGNIQGLRMPNSPTWAPPPSPFPQLTYVDTDWMSAGYTIRNYPNQCASAANDLKGTSATPVSGWTTPTVMRITGCQLQVTNLSNVNLASDLAIISDQGIEFQNQTTVKSLDGTDKELHLIVPYGSACPAAPSVQGWIKLGENFTMPAPVRTLLYSPCKLSLQNSGLIQGQFYGGSLEFANKTQLAYRPVSGVPGYSPITTTTFERYVTVLYRREIEK